MTHEPEESTNPNAVVLRNAIAGLTARDEDLVSACFHDDGVLVLPYEKAVAELDKAGMRSLLQMLFRLYRQFAIELTHIYDLTDPGTLVARYEGDCISQVGDVRYINEYIAVFEFTDGLISNWREYDNPMISAAALEAIAAASADKG